MRFCLLLWICAAWLGQCHSKAADPLTDAFLPTTRIIGAVTLQKQICDNEKIIPDVISELINVDKDIFKEFMTKHLESDIKGIKNASEFLRKTKSVDSVKLDKTLKGFAKLTGLKKQEANLKEEYIEKAVASIEKSASVSVKLQQDKKEFSVLIFKSVKNLLEDIVNQNLTGNNEDLKNKFVPIYTQLEILESKLPLLIDYKNQYADFLALDTMEKTVNGALEVVELIRGVFDNFDDIKVFDSVTPLLTEQMLPLRRNIAQFVKHQKSIKSTGESLKIISQLKYSESKREFLNGLPNGSEDLKAVTQDLKSSWFLNNWANGKKTDSIENGLKAIIESSNSFTNATNQMKTISIDSGAVKSFQEFEKAVSELVTLGEQAIKNNNAEETLGKMSPCVQQMAQTGTVPKLGETDKIVEYVPKIVERVKSFQEITESLLKDRNLLDNFIAGLKEVITVSKRVFDNSTLQIALDKCKELDLVNNYNSIWTDLLRYSPSQFYLGADTIKASVLSEALTAAKTAKIFDAVVCLPSTAGGVSDLINFSQKFNELKAIDGKLTASIPSLTTVVGFSKEVNKAIAELKKTKTESGTQLICNLPKDYPKTAAPLLVFGSLANNIVKIRNSESSILVVANSTGPVKAAAESVPDSSLVYNQANRKSLLDTLKSVKNVSDSIGKLGMESSDDLLEISKEIKNIKGFVMENSTILTNIADSLAQNSNPDVKNASTDFKVVSNLDLDFSSSSKVEIRKRDFEVLFDPLFPPEIIVISVIDRKQLFVYPACSVKSSIFQLYKADEEDGSKICTDTDEFRFTGNEGYQFDETIKIVKKNPCRFSSQCDSEEYCSSSRKCTKKSDACISLENPKVKCHFHCPSSICVSLDPKEVYCCPKNASKELPSTTCHVDEDCGPKQFCRTNNFGMSNCAEKEKSEEDLIAPTLEEVHMSYRDLPLSNFRRDNKKCDIEILKKFKPGTAFCPGDLIPLGHEHKCFGSVIQDDSSGRCLHPAGFCLKGYCCLQVHAKKDKLPLKPYLSRVECDPDCPLPSDWLYGFCDPVKRKVAFIGEELLYAKKKFEDTAYRKPENCKLNKDCINQNVCVIIPRFNSTTKEKMSSFECWVNPLRPPTPPDIFKPSLNLLAYLGMILFFIFIDLYKGTPYVEDNED